MPWDDTKDTFRTRPDVPADEKLTSGEWNNHVTDQKDHSTRHENGGVDEISVEGLSGVLADAQTPQTEAVEDIVGALLSAGTNIGLTYDDANNVLTVDTTALNEEEVEDAVAALITAGNAITVNYDDANDSLSISVDESNLSFYDGTNLTADVDNDSVSTGSITDSGDGQAWETLREAGFEKGDFVPVGQGHTFPSTYSNSNTTYTNVTATSDRFGPDFDRVPSGVDLYLLFSGRLSTDTGGETAFARLEGDGLASSPELSVTGTAATADSDVVAVTDTTVDTEYRIDMKSSVGTATAAFRNPPHAELVALL